MTTTDTRLEHRAECLYAQVARLNNTTNNGRKAVEARRRGSRGVRPPRPHPTSYRDVVRYRLTPVDRVVVVNLLHVNAQLRPEMRGHPERRLHRCGGDDDRVPNIAGFGVGHPA